MPLNIVNLPIPATPEYAAFSLTRVELLPHGIHVDGECQIMERPCHTLCFPSDRIDHRIDPCIYHVEDAQYNLDTNSVEVRFTLNHMDVANHLDSIDDMMCPVCRSMSVEDIMWVCGCARHHVCTPCLMEMLNHTAPGTLKCPVCRADGEFHIITNWDQITARFMQECPIGCGVMMLATDQAANHHYRTECSHIHSTHIVIHDDDEE